jgi:hypothetical protein
MVWIIATHKTADEPDHNRGSSHLGPRRHSGVGYYECGERSSRRRSG